MDAHRHGVRAWYPGLLLGVMVLFFAACSSGGSGGTSSTAGRTVNDPAQVDTPGQTGDSGDDPANTDTPGQTGEPGDGRVQRISFDLGGYRRSYELYVPAAYTGSSPVPLVLDFHGLYSSAGTERHTSGFQAKAEAEGFVVAYPEGISGLGGQSWNADASGGQWYSWANLVDVDDVAFAIKVAEDVRGRVNVDAGRIYLTGLSQGGAMALLCAHDRGDVFAAAASVSAALLKKLDDYRPVRPIPVVCINSYDDDIVPYGGNALTGLPPMEDAVRQWAVAERCDYDSPEVSSLGYTDPGHPDVAEKVTVYRGGSGGSEVRLYSLHGSHVLYLNNFHGSTAAEKQAYITGLAWDFLTRFTL